MRKGGKNRAWGGELVQPRSCTADCKPWVVDSGTPPEFNMYTYAPAHADRGRCIECAGCTGWTSRGDRVPAPANLRYFSESPSEIGARFHYATLPCFPRTSYSPVTYNMIERRLSQFYCTLHHSEFVWNYPMARGIVIDNYLYFSIT